MLTLIESASLYIQRGWAVFPCKAKGKTPATEHGFKDASTDPAVISAWWGKQPRANIGIATGRMSGIVVLDVDVWDYEHDTPKAGLDSLAALEEKHGLLPVTLTQRTGTGGLQYLFQHPDVPLKNRAGLLGEGLDIRADGGYIVAPPSIHPNGEAYAWLDEGAEIAPLPVWLLDVLLAPPSEERKSAPVDSNATIEYVRPSSAYAEAALVGELRRLRSAPSGQRNHTLNRCAFSLGQLVGAGALDRTTAERELQRAALEIGLNERETDATIKSGLNAGEKQPREVKRTVRTYAEQQADEIAEKATEKIEAVRRRAGRPTDDELAQEWVDSHPNTAYGIGEFRRYNAGVWDVMPTGQAEGEIMDILVAAKGREIKPTRNLLASVTKLAQVLTRVADECWDANFDVLVCANGTLHIPTMQLREHEPRNYCTFGVPYPFDANADCSTFNQVLAERVPEASELIQEFAGLALTPDQRYEIALWFYGPRGSGKSTIIEGIQAMLGKRAGLLGLADIESSRFALAELPGKTLVVSTEQPGHFVGATHTLNKIISGEPVTVERKYRDAMTVIPRAKVLWAMNELPRVGDSADGIFRRVQTVRFPASIAQPDPAIKEKIRTEGTGILNWALAGLQRLRKRGRFVIPDSVKLSNQDFETRNDIPSVYVDECCERGNSQAHEIAAMQLYASYKSWCDATGHKAQSSTSMGHEWQRLGFVRVKKSTAYYWQGLKLK